MTPRALAVLMCGALMGCTSAPTVVPSPSLEDAAFDAELRFGSHLPCASNPDCPNAEACGYAVILGCGARGECVKEMYCSEHTQLGPACACDGGTVAVTNCRTIPITGYWPVALQSTTCCPGDLTDVDGGCVTDAGTACCALQCATCSNDYQCCAGRHCVASYSGFKRCL